VIPNSLQHFPLGQRFPDTPHAVCVSLPTMADVIGYEEKNPETIARMKSGYPRFKLPGFVDQLAKHIAANLKQTGHQVLLVSSEKAGRQLMDFIGEKDVQMLEMHGIQVIHFPENADHYSRGFKFLQHTGTGISSRQAEDILYKLGLVNSIFLEKVQTENLERKVVHTLTRLTRIPAEDTLLCNSGMNAFYAAFQATAEIQRPRNRTIWIQLGWLYLDTSEILKKFLKGEEKHIRLLNVFDLEELKRVLEKHAGEVAAIVTEAPTNPLIQTPDMPEIHQLAKSHGAILIADPTSSTPVNINLLPHCDILANSLTKYAASQGDVLSGAIFFNKNSSFYTELKEITPSHHETPYLRDLQRLAHEIQDYEETLSQIDRNAMKLANYLEKHPAVAKVHWAYSEESGENFKKLARKEEAPGCLITIELHGAMQPIHDRLQLLKSPSFGTAWSMICPFMYLAHYDLVSTQEGKSFLSENQINGELLRISVGTEPIEKLVQTFEETLAQ
jgi:cystathionine gamma-synthase